ncbi:hypothetical protein ABFS82_06G021500 [Erythranthe guttata]|uniref:O-acyltransferase WSD1-like n=1 Tax=Erythranthe guttata TaxID=4155 RepID=UPI00064DF459|nr:PREDICTED: O-acyltransferase WSD1-like [Erythranthe guttata]|eukprot:XP_012852330.1 PREDICTED: O-acyltransferase WSD1-like [Erythranthe guttata]
MSRNEEKDHELEPVSPGARLMQAPGLNLCIIAVMGFTTKIDPNVFKKGLQDTLIKHPRFSSLLIVKNSKFTWKRTRVEMEEHVFVPDLDPEMEYSGDEFVEDYMSALSTTPMDMKKPLWEIHILNVKTSDADSVLVFKIHHSIGDGVSLTALVLACARKTSDPESLPVISSAASARKRKPDAAVDKGFLKRVFVLVWTVVLVVFNTCSDCMLFLATVLFLKDKWTPIKVARGDDALSSRKRFVHRIISLDDVKLVKTAMNVSINDVILGITEAGLSRYLNMRYGKIRENVTDQENMKKSSKNHLPKNLCIRSAVVFNLRPSATIEDMAEVMENAKELKGTWGNLIGICLLPLTISLHEEEEDPLIHVRRAKSTMDAKKLSLGHKCAFAVMKLMMFLFGNKIAGGVSRKVFQNTTLTFSNVVGPEEEITLFGHPLSYIAPSVHGFPQALIIHYQSYGDKLIIAMGADEKLIPNPHQLCDDLAISLLNMKQAVIKKGLVQFC